MALETLVFSRRSSGVMEGVTLASENVGETVCFQIRGLKDGRVELWVTNTRYPDESLGKRAYTKTLYHTYSAEAYRSIVALLTQFQPASGKAG